MRSPSTSGEIITFYSYKGGTGRSMAMSNVACLLAQQVSDGDGVLMIDWDLEAPGLHRFFYERFQQRFAQVTDPAQALAERPGLIDLFIELETSIPESDATEEEIEKIAIEALDSIELKKFIVETDIPNLSFLKAGQFDDKYSGKVNTFNWEGLYNKSPSLIRLLAERLAEEYRYVLIDSRTGHTDISGICTMLMPQKLVVVFTPNRQSYTGIEELVKQATDYRRQSDDLRPLMVYPLPSRIEFSRDDLRADWRFGKPEQNIIGYQPLFEELLKEVYELPNCKLNDYFEDVQIQQSPNYAYGEEIAVLVEKTVDRFSLTRSYNAFTDWLVNSTAPWQKTMEKINTLNISAQELFDEGMFDQASDKWNEVLHIDVKNQIALDGIKKIDKLKPKILVSNVFNRNKLLAYALITLIFIISALFFALPSVITPQLSISPDPLSFGFVTTGESKSQNFYIENTGGGTLEWSVSSDSEWLKVNPTRGIDSAMVTVNINVAGLSPGSYIGTITIDSNYETKIQNVYLTILPRDNLSEPKKRMLAVLEPFGGDVSAAANAGLEQTGSGQFFENGSYYIIELQGEKYVALYGKMDNLAKLTLEQGVEDSTVLIPNETWDIGDGWSITIKDIDINKQITTIRLNRYGEVIDSYAIKTGRIYTYVGESVAGENEVPLFVTYVDTLFSDKNGNLVRVKYSWVITPLQ